MAKAKLTKKTVDGFTAPPGVEQAVLWDTAVRGYGVRLSVKSNTKAYFIQFRVKGSNKERSITIGRHADPWTPELARARALELKSQMLGDGVTGIDPVAEGRRKEAERKAQEARDGALGITLQQVLDSYLSLKNLRSRTIADYKRHCEKNFAEWLEEPIANLTRDKVLSKFTAISKRAPGQANLSMAYLRALCHHARALKRTPEGSYPLLPMNPVTAMWELADPNDETPRTTRISLDKVGVCWNWLRDRAAHAHTEKDRIIADYVSALMLTGCRRNEMGALKWTDVDFDGRTLTLRKDMTKTKRELVLPLSSVLYDILKARKDGKDAASDNALRRRHGQLFNSEYVFPSGGRKTPHVIQAPAVIKELSTIAGKYVHLHALRRTADDIAMECKIDSDVRRMLLNHVGVGAHGTAYSNNPAFLTPAVEAVAAWIVAQGRIAAAPNIVQFPQRGLAPASA